MLGKPKTKLRMKSLQKRQGSKEKWFRELKLMYGKGNDRNTNPPKSTYKALRWFLFYYRWHYSFCIFKSKWWLYKQDTMKSQDNYSFPSGFRNVLWREKLALGTRLYYINSLSLLIEFWEKKLCSFLLGLFFNCYSNTNQIEKHSFNAIYLKVIWQRL